MTETEDQAPQPVSARAAAMNDTAWTDRAAISQGAIERAARAWANVEGPRDGWTPNAAAYYRKAEAALAASGLPARVAELEAALSNVRDELSNGVTANFEFIERQFAPLDTTGKLG